MPKTYLEPEFAEPFTQWQAKPTPETTTVLLNSVKPVIDKSVTAFAGSGASPLLRSRARQIALKAFKTYDPMQARLSTHLANHLRGLNRVSRQQNQILAIPERMSMDAGMLHQKEIEIEDTLGRPPSSSELADATGLSLRRIAKLRQMRAPVAEGTIMAATTGPESAGILPAVQSSGSTGSNALADLIYDDLDGPNQVILEHSLGLHGKPVMANKDIARKLGVSPGAISQRKALIQRRMDELADTGMF